MRHTIYVTGLMITVVLLAAISGFFYAYQVSVIRGLDVIDPQSAIRAMQGINAEVRNAWFAPSFFGALAAPLVMAWVALQLGRRTDAGILVLVTIIYGVGGFLLTALWNVPLNQELARILVPADGAEAARIWKNYRDPWMLGNTLRTCCSFASLLLLAWIPLRKIRSQV